MTGGASTVSAGADAATFDGEFSDADELPGGMRPAPHAAMSSETVLRHENLVIIFFLPNGPGPKKDR